MSNLCQTTGASHGGMWRCAQPRWNMEHQHHATMRDTYDTLSCALKKYCYLTLWNSLGFIKHSLLYSVMQLNTLKLGHVLTHFRHGDSIAVHIQSMTIYRWSLNQGASDQVGSLWIFTWANIISTYFNEY